MAKKRGTSVAPMILGIIGGVLGIPGAFCAGACVACITAFTESTTEQVQEMGEFYMIACLIAAGLGLLFGILSKRFPIFSGIILIIAALIGGITLIAGNFIALIMAILFLIGGFMSIFQKKEVIN